MKAMKHKFLSTAVAALLVLSGCSNQNPTNATGGTTGTESTGFTAGTYSAEGQGIHGPVKVDVTFSDSAITDIQIGENTETKNIGDRAMEIMASRILDQQSLAVDTVSSATFSSKALLDAVTDAVTQAGGNVDALKSVNVEAAKDETIDTDVLVVGMGLTGVTAAISALDQGASVVAVEKAGMAGGSSMYSGGFLTAVNSKWQKEAGYDLDVAGYMDYFNTSEDLSVKKDETDRAAVQAMIERSAADLDFLEEHGIKLTGPDGFGGDFTVWHYPATRTSAFDGFAGGADHIVAGMEYLNAQDNFTIYYDTPATELLVDADGNVTGVKCVREDGSTLTVNAKAVVLATGGYAGSQELMARFCPDFPKEWIIPYTTASLQDTGDGITMAETIGAAVYEDGWWMDLAIGVDVGGYSTYFADSMNGLLNYANYFVVDGTGKRILNVNSLYGPRSIAFAEAMKETGVIYSIFTSEGFADGIQFIEDNNLVDSKNIYKADTLEDLATQTGMDVETLTSQVERYNGFCTSGTDEDMGQTTLIPVGDGPYYAINIKTITMGSIGGLKTNDDNQVIKADGTPIGGLYAGGELINGKYFNQVYVSGDAQLLCADSGILAGANAAKSALGK